MTEAAWLTCQDSLTLLKQLDEPVPERKSRLLMLACSLLRKRQFRGTVVREAVAALDLHFADSSASDRPFNGRKYVSLRTRLEQYIDRVPTQEDYLVALAVWAAMEPEMDSSKCGFAEYQLRLSLENLSCNIRGKIIFERRVAQAELIRDIFGNPFRPVAFDPRWQTSTAVGLARTLYDARDFGAMPILADALQDAGCEDDAILSHCRDTTQVHVRGCWVVDLVLGRS